MARKKMNKPFITHAELLNLAYRALEQDIRQWEQVLKAVPDENQKQKQSIKRICGEQAIKLTAIRRMYLFETGTEI